MNAFIQPPIATIAQAPMGTHVGIGSQLLLVWYPTHPLCAYMTVFRGACVHPPGSLHALTCLPLA